MVNRGPFSIFKASRGLIQGNQLFPLLFIVVMEALNKWMLKVRELELFRGLKLYGDEHTEEVTHLFFADYTLMFCELEEKTMLNPMCPVEFSSSFGS